MTNDLEALLKQLLKSVVREIAANFMEAWELANRHGATQRTADDGFLLTPRETAKRLAISERHLFQLTRAGELPHVRVGKCVRYSIETIQKWVRETESRKPPPRTPRDDSGQIQLKPASTSPPRKQKHKAGRKRRDSAIEKEPGPQLTPKVRQHDRRQGLRSEERISPLSVLLSEIDVDRGSLPPITTDRQFFRVLFGSRSGVAA